MDARNPTRTNYDYYQRAYDHFNAALFGDSLPRCLITLQRNRKAYGYFHSKRWAQPGRLEAQTDEIALNPAGFSGRSAEDVLATLVQEMVLLWQHHQGEKPSSAAQPYHNKEWAAKMKEIGLQPTDTGEEGGKETGRRVGSAIIPGGAFAVACAEFTGTEGTTCLPYIDREAEPEAVQRIAKQRAASKTKYACLSCGTNIWGKPGLRVGCVDCNEVFRPMAGPKGEAANDDQEEG